MNLGDTFEIKGVRGKTIQLNKVFDTIETIAKTRYYGFNLPTSSGTVSLVPLFAGQTLVKAYVSFPAGCTIGETEGDSIEITLDYIEEDNNTATNLKTFTITTSSTTAFTLSDDIDFTAETISHLIATVTFTNSTADYITLTLEVQV